MITKEQWNEIEERLARRMFGRAIFQLGSDKISVNRQSVSESKSALVVYFNDCIKGIWSGNPASENYNPLIEKFWHKKSAPKFSPKLKSQLIKIWGKRDVRKHSPDLDERIFYWVCTWPKAKTLVNHFKKIKDLELIADAT